MNTKQVETLDFCKEAPIRNHIRLSALVDASGGEQLTIKAYDNGFNTYDTDTTWRVYRIDDQQNRIYITHLAGRNTLEFTRDPQVYYLIELTVQTKFDFEIMEIKIFPGNLSTYAYRLDADRVEEKLIKVNTYLEALAIQRALEVVGWVTCMRSNISSDEYHVNAWKVPPTPVTVHFVPPF